LKEQERELYYHDETQKLADKLAARPPYILPNSVKIDLSAYTGVWYETHRSKLPSETFEKGLQCVTAFYADPKPDSFLGIFNDVPTLQVTQGGRIGAPDGEEKTSHSTLWQFDDERSPGKLLITMPGKFWIGAYYVHKIGPKGKDGLYDWAVVTDDLGSMAWILARHPRHRTQHILDMLVEEGFDKEWNTLQPTYQGKDCVYPDYAQ
jgi:lipocalin